METKNENQSKKSKLKEINQLSPDAQNYSYGSCGSCGCGCGSGWESGWGTGSDDCMSQELFLKLSDSGALKSEVYVCGWGWTLPGVTAYGSCGSGGVAVVAGRVAVAEVVAVVVVLECLMYFIVK